jgi:hypothetical protein
MEIKQLKTFEDACKVLGLDNEKVLPDFSFFPEKHQKAMTAHSKLVLIAQAANRIANGGVDWTPDWNNYDQFKYHPWFAMDGGSSGFRLSGYDGWDSLSPVGSRLCFISSEVAEYVGETFVELYKDYFTL